MIKGKIVDLSHRMEAGREEYGLKQNIFQTGERYQQYKTSGDVWYIMQNLEMSSHCGTHVEFPFHHVKDGMDAASFPLENLVGEAVLLDFRHKKKGEAVTLADVRKHEDRIRMGDMVLFFYDAGKLYYTERAHDRPYVEIEAIRWLIQEKNIRLLGTDSSGFEKSGAVDQPVHTFCLDNGVPILEFGANFDRLRRDRFLLFILPLPIEKLDSSPVRMVAIEPELSMTPPFATSIDPQTSQLLGADKHEERRVSDLAGYFYNESARVRLAQSNNPVVYRVAVREVPHNAGALLHAITVIESGDVDGECFMTKGHYHLDPQCTEIYYILRGRGLVLLQNGDATHTLELQPGTVAYTPPGWGHRTVNVSPREPLIFFSVWPAQSGYDYPRVANEPFRQHVLRKGDSFEIR